ncbi:MAG TPA: sensor histidine kinase [Desulfobacterales bacterium]|nr:sensor histidine kinase [Desulfobacterales bacterium]
MPKSRHTIRYRLIRLYCLSFAIIALMIIAYSWQMLSFEKKMTNLENVHALFDNVLEMRRYEKNFLLHAGDGNLTKIILYLKKVEGNVNESGASISQIAGQAGLQHFIEALQSYKAIFQHSSPTTPVNPGQVRRLGKILANFTDQLLSLQHPRIRHELKLIFYSYIIVTGLFFLVILPLFMMRVKNILQRMSFLQKAIHDLANDNFTPIPDSKGENDEVSELLLAFNKMAEELNAKQNQLIRSRKLAAIGTFSSGVAHELNNPLNNISLSADTLLEEYHTLSLEESKEILTDIMIQTERAGKIVKNLLDFSRDKAPETATLNIREVINPTIDLIANQLKINSIWVENYIPADLPAISGDLQQLQQVFLNLFLNSIQVMPDGGLIHLKAEEEPKGYIRVNVGDTGSGIAPEHIEHIFAPFYTTKEVGKGTGLGLSIVYGIIKKHGGYIKVKSKINVGTTFSVYLPLAAADQGKPIK